MMEAEESAYDQIAPNAEQKQIGKQKRKEQKKQKILYISIQIES